MSLYGLVMDIWSVNLEYFLLMLLRTGSLIMSSPLFGRRDLPNRYKICFALSLTMLFYMVFPPAADLVYANIGEFVMLCILELLFGLVLAFVANMFFMLVFTSGQLADMQIGFGMVNIYDPQSGISAPVTGTLLNIILLVCFYMVDGHHRLITIVYKTFEHVPIGQVVLDARIGIAALEVFIDSMVLALQIAMPFIAMGLVVEAVMGVLIRTMPQMNMFVVGMPLKIIVGFIMFVMVAEVFVPYSNTLFDYMFDGIEKMFYYFIPR